MKKVILSTLIIISIISASCSSGQSGSKSVKTSADLYVSQLSEAGFKKAIFDYDANKDWKYEGGKPAIIDFYADWCPPCKKLSPLVEEAAKEYAGKITFYKVNSDNESALLQKLGISNLPTLLYIPAKGKPRVTMGFIPKEELEKAIKEILLSN
jgi:thioredoxin 1